MNFGWVVIWFHNLVLFGSADRKREKGGERERGERGDRGDRGDRERGDRGDRERGTEVIGRGVTEVIGRGGTEVIGRGATEVTGRGGTEVKGGRGVGTEEKGVEVGMEEVKAEDDNSTTSKIGPLDQVCII